MPTPCPPGLPQAACDFANVLVTASQPSGGVSPGWDASNVLTTFQQWYATTAPAQRQLPTPPIDPAAYMQGASLAAAVLKSATDFWSKIGFKIPDATKGFAPTSISSFPWQYFPQGSTADPMAIAFSTLETMAADPLARAFLQNGVLPPFDATKVDWTTFSGSPLWKDPNVWPAVADAMAKFAPTIQVFLQRAQKCQTLFSQSPNVIHQAFVNFMTFGGDVNDSRGDPCAVLTPTLPVPIPDKPATPVTPPKVTPPKAPLPMWVPIALTAAGVGLLGAIVYMVTRPSPTAARATILPPAPKLSMENPLHPRRRRRRRRRSTQTKER